MSEWQPIEEIPDDLKDGREVYVKRMSPSHPGEIVAEGFAVFAELHAAAPSRASTGFDPLGRLTAADYAREDKQRREWVASKKWLLPNRMYAFPTPTHWRLEQDA